MQFLFGDEEGRRGLVSKGGLTVGFRVWVKLLVDSGDLALVEV